MLQLIKTALLLFIDDIDSKNSNINENLLKELLGLILKINSKELSKLEATDYIGVFRATFDKYVNESKLPRGEKRIGFKELSLRKQDLNNFLECQKQ